MTDCFVENEHFYRCLDHGFVRLVDSMGGDQAIVQAARVSLAGAGTRPVSEDRGLIRYLMRHRHTSPFEMAEVKLHCKMPIFVARQWIRHRTANVNEMSGRYSELPEEFYVPEIEHIQAQAIQNKQGRADEALHHGVAQLHRDRMVYVASLAFRQYHDHLYAKMARELARINLPLSTYTEWYWKIDLHNLMHFLSLRLTPHAQYEIRVYAEAIAKIVQALAPLTWEAFVDFRLEAMTLSRIEIEHLKGYTTGDRETVAAFPTKREADEWHAKLITLGLDRKRRCEHVDDE